MATPTVSENPSNVDADYEGYITPLLKKLLPWVSPLYWWKVKCNRNVDPTAKQVERYIAIWLVVQLALSGLLWSTPECTGASWIVVAFLALWRVLDIIQACFHLYIFTDHRKPIRYVSRVVVLAIVNYVELILSFALIYSACARTCASFKFVSSCGNHVMTFWDYVYFSGITQLTIGYGDLVPSGFARFIAMGQALIGLAMTVFIFARFSISLASLEMNNPGQDKAS